jgi:hypothetical protein
MEDKNKSHIHAKFLVVVGCMLATLLLTTPCSGQFVTVGSDEELDIGTGYDIEEPIWYLYVHGTVNLHPGAHVKYAIYAYDGSTVNIFGGQLGPYGFIWLISGEPSVTVYGTDFAVGGVLLGSEVTTFIPVSSNQRNILTVTYGNGDRISLKFYSNVPIHLEILRPEVEIDIKPGSDMNPINLKAKGVVPVAVLTTNEFDAQTIDRSTVQFAGATPVRWTLEDVDKDGDDDMLFHFKTQDLNLTEDSTEAILTGQVGGQLTATSSINQLSSGAPIYGTDKVHIKSSKK